MITTKPFSTEQQWESGTSANGGIVVGFDGSPVSRSAIETASAIATAHGWMVHVVSVLPPMSSYKWDPGVDEPASEINDLRIQLRDAAIRDAIGEDGARAGWTRYAVIGNPAREITQIAEKSAANLIILGRRKRSATERFLDAETTTQVMRGSSVPVLLVEDEMRKPSIVVAAVDFRTASVGAVTVALRLLAGSGTLYLVHVEAPSDVLPERTAPADVESFPGEILGLFRRLLGRLQPPAGVVVETILLSGAPVPAITEFCELVGADLIAVGTRGLPGAARAILGSVSLGLVRKVPIPIIVSPHRAGWAAIS